MGTPFLHLFLGIVLRLGPYQKFLKDSEDSKYTFFIETVRAGATEKHKSECGSPNNPSISLSWGKKGLKKVFVHISWSLRINADTMIGLMGLSGNLPQAGK